MPPPLIRRRSRRAWNDAPALPGGAIRAEAPAERYPQPGQAIPGATPPCPCIGAIHGHGANAAIVSLLSKDGRRPMRTSNRARWTALITAALAAVLVSPAGARGVAEAQVAGGTRPVVVRGDSWVGVA